MKVKAVMHELCCAHCAAKIEEKVAKLDGVDNVLVNFLTERMTLEVREEKWDVLRQQIEKIVKKIEPDVKIEYLP